MKGYLIFKRNNKGSIQMKVVPVDIPEVSQDEGWSIASFTNTIDIVDSSQDSSSSKENSDKESAESEELPPLKKYGDKVICDVVGTAKLVRAKDKVFIAYRKGKTTYNQSTPDSVCISDTVRNEFFRQVRMLNKVDEEYSFRIGDYGYSYWHDFVTKEYKRQIDSHNSRVRRVSA